MKRKADFELSRPSKRRFMGQGTETPQKSMHRSEPSHEDDLTLLRKAYASDRAASQDLAHELYKTLPRELRDLIYHAAFPESVQIASMIDDTRIDIAKMMGRPRYLFPAYVGTDVATEASQGFYKSVLIVFKSSATAPHIWGFLHEDIFGVGVVPRTFIRRLCIQDPVSANDLLTIKRRTSPRSCTTMDNGIFEESCQQILVATWKTHNHIRYQLGDLCRLTQKMQLTLEVQGTWRDIPELRYFSPLLLGLRERGWQIKLAMCGGPFGQSPCTDLTSCLDKPTADDRKIVREIAMDPRNFTRLIRRRIHEYDPQVMYPWYRVQVHDHRKLYERKQRELSLESSEVEHNDALYVDDLTSERWLDFCRLTVGEEQERAYERMFHKEKEL